MFCTWSGAMDIPRPLTHQDREVRQARVREIEALHKAFFAGISADLRSRRVHIDEACAVRDAWSREAERLRRELRLGSGGGMVNDAKS